MHRTCEAHGKRLVYTHLTQKETFQQLQSQPQSYKTPGSTHSLRRTFRHLQNEGKIHPDAVVLLHAGEKLATNLNIVQHEVVGLRKAIIHEKKRRKRGKAMHLYDGRLLHYTWTVKGGLDGLGPSRPTFSSASR
jgi:hypothetical protein